ncbi:MAG TPA: hypothetical protein VLG11_00070 [Candidatus Saccharimonadales bacterium]|nr:hypothetical protein [Candidatus Saccharimonadales bacterium]
MSGVRPEIQGFFERFPAAHDAYADSKLYHLTHSRYVPGIQTEGLRPNADLFPAEQGVFLLHVCSSYSSGQPSDIEYVQNRILNSGNIYLSATVPDMSDEFGYGIPERLVFLMRGMAALATKSSLTEAERNFAARALEGHRTALTEGEPAIVALQVDPLAPGVVNNRLGNVPLDGIHDETLALDAVRYVDGPYGNNIPIQSAIEPGFITVFDQKPITAERAMQTVNAEPGWAAAIR